METGEGCQLFCLCNDHGPGYQTFRVSPLAQAFPVGLYDPLQQEAAGEALIIRGAFDRRRADVVSANLHQITGRRVYSMDFSMTSDTIAVPRGVLSAPFLQLDSGQSDYAAERDGILGNAAVDELVDEIERRRKKPLIE